MSNFILERVSESTEIISELTTMSIREESIRLGNPDDAHFSTDYSRFVSDKLEPFLMQLRDGLPSGCMPFFGNSGLFVNLSKILDLLKPSSMVNPVRSSARLGVLEVFRTMPLSFDPSLSRFHLGLCSMLWDVIETDSEEGSLLGLKIFGEIYKTPHQVLMDAEFASRLSKFVVWLRSVYTSRMSSLLAETANCAHLLTQLFPSAGESFLVPLIGDMMSSMMATSSAGAVKTLTFVAYVSRSSRGELLRPFDQQICRACINLLRSVAGESRRELILNVRALFHVPELSLVFIQWIDDLFDESIFVGIGKSSQELLRPIVVSALADFANSIRDKIPMDKLRKVIVFFTSSMGDCELPIPAQFAAARILLTLVDQLFNKSSNRAKKWPPAAPGGNPSDGSDILRDILRATIEKFSSLMLFIPNVIALVKKELHGEEGIGNCDCLSQLVSSGSKTGIPLADLLIEGVREIRSLIRTLLLTSKMTIHCLTHRVSSRMLTKSDVSLIDSLLEDSLKCAHLFSVAAGLVQSAGFEKSISSSANGGGRFGSAEELAVACSLQEERELIDQVGSVLIVMPGISLTDLLAKRIGWLLASICENSQLMSLINCLVTHATGVQSLTEVLCGYLAVTRDREIFGSRANSVAYFLGPSMVDSSGLVTYVMPSLNEKLRSYAGIIGAYGLRKPGGAQTQDVVITILKSIARQIYGTSMVLEPIVRPFVVSIVSQILSSDKDILYRLGLLRYVFRLMGSGIKTSSTIRELADLVGEALEFCFAQSLKEGDGIVGQLWLEIGLTFPVRLKSLIPVFDLAMTLMVRLLGCPVSGSVESSISVGLTVLESWVDGLTPDFLFPLIGGHGEMSLVQALFKLVEPPHKLPVHSAVSGSHAVRATKILGKLGARARFHTESHNLTGHSHKQETLPCETIFALDDHSGVEVDISSAIQAATDLLEEYSTNILLLPVSLQDQQLQENIPEQELMDAFTLLATTLPQKGWIFAAACRCDLVAERARIFIEKHASLLADCAVEELVADPAFERRTRVILDTVLPHCGDFSRLFDLLVDRLVALDWRIQLGACLGLGKLLSLSFVPDDVSHLFSCLIKAHQMSAEVRASVEDLVSTILQVVKKIEPEIVQSVIVVEMVALPARDLPEIILNKLGVKALTPACVELIENAITNASGPVFQLTQFLLVNNLGDPGCIEKGILRALEWSENEDELSLLHGQRRLPNTTDVGYLFHRASVRKTFVKSNGRILQVLRLFGAFLARKNLEIPKGGPLPCYLVASREWTVRERICVFVGRCLFSCDSDLVELAEQIISTDQAILTGPVWTDALLPLCVEIASRAPMGISEIQGLGRLIVCASEDASSLFPLLMERLHSYLSVLRERTYAPMQTVGPGLSLSWRAGMQSDSIVALSVITLAAAARTTPIGGLEKLLVLTSQLEAALPGTCGSGQIASPFLAPLIAGLCSGETNEGAAEEILTKLELHKVFPLVAELVSTPRCLALRKALQDKCHAMSAVDGAGLMMRPATASLVSVLARFDPSYLWIQYCASSSSLISVLTRNWEASIQTLCSSSAIAGLKQTNQLVLGPGGIVGPADINGFEGRIVAWTIIQFIRAPFLLNAFTVTTAEQSSFRVRLLLRLACSLSLRAAIEVCAIQNWFLTESPLMTTESEKVDLISKSLDLIQDPNISSGCKFALLRYIVVPQTGCEMDFSRLHAVLFSPHNVSLMDEGIRVELLKLLLVLPAPPLDLVNAFLAACVHTITPVVLQFVGKVVSAHPGFAHWDDAVLDALLTGDVLADASPALLKAILKRVSVEGLNDKVWRWVILGKVVFQREALRLVARRATSVESRDLALDVALWLARGKATSDFLATFFLRHCIGGPDGFVGTNPVSPTLTSEFMTKCSEGMRLCSGHKLDLSSIELTIPRLPHNPAGTVPPELMRHCKQLVAGNRMLAVYFKNGGSAEHQSAHVCHLVNTAIVSTDKSVCVSLCALVESWTAMNPATDDHPVLRCIVDGIAAGLQIAANSPCRIKLHPLNPHSASWSVTPYMAVSVLVAFLRGLATREASVRWWLDHFKPALLKAVTQGARSLVFSLLPQHMHHFPLSQTKYPLPALEQSQELSGTAYPGNLQGPEFAVPTLLHIMRVAHLAIDTSETRDVSWENCVLWLMECLGPFVTFASNANQSFGQVLISLNFSVPQTKTGGLASVVPAVHVAALVRHLLGIVARWTLGMQYSLKDSSSEDWLLDDHPIEGGENLTSSRLVLSGSTAMVGTDALLTHLDLAPVVHQCMHNTTSTTRLPHLVHAICILDGFGILTPLCDGSVQKLLGFVPKRAVTCFPGSALTGKPGALFEMACEVLKELSASEVLLPALLVGAMHDKDLMDSLVAMAPVDFAERLKWILTIVPWEVLGGRDLAPLFVHLLLAHVTSLDSAMLPCIRSLLAACAVSIGTQLCQLVPEETFELFVNFLSRPILEKQALFRPSIVGMLIRGVGCSFPAPLLLHLAKQHGVYFEVLEVLDLMKSSIDSESILRAIGELDAMYGSQLLGGRIEPGLAAFMQQERWKSASAFVGRPEWIECQSNLCEWPTLAEGADHLHPVDKLEVFCKTNDWGAVAETMGQYDWSTTGKAKIFAAYLALSFSDACHTGTDASMKQRVFLADMEASINRSFHHLVSEWNLLPKSSSALDLILLCQEFVEFNEAAVLVSDVRGAITGLRPAYPNPKQLLNSWRDRLPDKYDSLRNWHELLNLRMVIFRHIQSQCSVDVVASSHIAPYLHDYPWSLVKLAQASLNHSNVYLAQSALSKFQASVSKSTDAFNQEIFDALRQQTRMYRKSHEETDQTLGLNVLNCCAISNSNSQQAAEIAWMQARFLMNRGELEEAKSALELSVNAYPMIVGAWISLGDLLWTQQEGGVDITSDCLRAYLQAVALSAGKSVRLVSRILCLVRKLAAENFVFEKSLDPSTWPSCVWLGWVPTLMRCLSDPLLNAVVKALLIKVGSSFPQAVVWQNVDSEVIEGIRKVHPNACTLLATFSDAVTTAFDSPGTEQVIRCLDDLRFKRKSAATIKKLLQLKTDPTESSLKQMIEELAEPDGKSLFAERGLGGVIEGVEIPGNYTRFITVPSGSAIESMSTVRAVGWDHEYEPQCMEEGGAVPRIRLLGSNGLWYAFTVHSGRPTGETIGEQIYAIVNWIFGKHRQSKIRNLQIKCLQSTPLSSNCYLRESIPTSTSLHAIGESNITDIFAKASSAEELFSISRRFTTSLATCSIVDYILGIHATSRSPKDIRLSTRNGEVYMTGFDLFELVKASETNLAHSVPFRLTRDIVGLIGDRNLAGVMPAVMRAAADAINKKATSFAEYLELLNLQEDQSHSENFSERIRDLLGDDNDSEASIYSGINGLIEESMNTANLANVQPKHFSAWL